MDDKDSYIANAVEHGRCVEKGDYENGNVAIDLLMETLAKLRQHSDSGQSTLLTLLSHPNGWVKLFAATHLLPTRGELAASILENLASGPQSELEFNATMILREWRAGRLKIP